MVGIVDEGGEGGQGEWGIQGMSHIRGGQSPLVPRYD